jgi:hypothetical protein
MNRDTAVARVQLKLGFRSDQATNIVNAFQDNQAKLELRPLLPWYLRTEISSNSTVSGEERVVTPSDFIREDEESALWYFDASADDEDKWTEIIKDDLSVLRHKFPGVGTPKAYAIHGDYFRIFPTPDAVYTLKLAYYQKQAVLTSNIENKWLLHASDLMIGMAGKDIATALRDADAVAIFKDMITEGQAQLLIDTEARRHENTRYIIGDLD